MSNDENGAKYSGEELTKALTGDGWIAYYHEGANDAPFKVIYKKADGSVRVVTEGITASAQKDSTCAEKGLAGFTADGIEFRLNKLPHTWETNYRVDTAPTCTEKGSESIHCTKCEETKDPRAAGAALGHKFETYVYNQDATTKENGTETAKCVHPGCMETDTREAPNTKLKPVNAEKSEAAPETAEAIPAAMQSYWVLDADGQMLTSREQLEGGVLTVTAQADTASLKFTVNGLRLLAARGVTELRLVTNGAQSAVKLADLSTYTTGTFTLTHQGAEVTFLLDTTDISSLLK